MAFEFTSENKRKFEEYLRRYPQKKAALLPALWLVQDQQGWINPEAMEYLASLLDVTPAYVYETATFYTMYNKKPIGRNHIQVCNSVCCWLRGSEQTVETIKKKIEGDPKFHLSTVECLGSCGSAPMMQINNDYFENLDEEKVDQILDKLKQSS